MQESASSHFVPFFYLPAPALVLHSCKFYPWSFLLQCSCLLRFPVSISSVFILRCIFSSSAKPHWLLGRGWWHYMLTQKGEGCTISPKQCISPIIRLLPSFLLCFALHPHLSQTRPSPSFLRGNLMVLGEGRSFFEEPTWAYKKGLELNWLGAKAQQSQAY